MTDIFTKSKRSEVMSRIRSSGNKETELVIIKLFRKNKITGWRRNYPLFGKPDFTFPKQRVVVFVDGCFWHGCPKHSNMPRSNRAFWKNKLDSNRARDRRVNYALKQKGWHVIRIWEHDLAKKSDRCILRIAKAINR